MSAEKSQTQVQLEKAGNVANVRFVPAAGVNIFSSRVIADLGAVIKRVAADRTVRFVVFHGHGRVFLAGADISEMQTFNPEAAQGFGQTGHAVFDAIESLPQVTIAAINGHAMGGGCELSMACDFRLMVRDGKIGQPEVRLGLIPGWGGTQRITRYVGLGWARRLLYGGESLSAEDAHRIGLVDEVVANTEELTVAVQRWITLLTEGSPAAIDRIKRAMASGDEVGEFSRCFSGPEAKEGMAAFHEKRKPGWAGAK